MVKPAQYGMITENDQGHCRTVQKQLCNVTMSTALKLRQLVNVLFPATWVFILTVALVLPGLALAQEVPYPQPLLPKANATGIPVTSITFTWTPFYVGTEEYTFQLSKNADMSNPIVDAKISGASTAYTYRGTLEYNTRYFWWVKASKPLGDWSPVSTFTTIASPSASTNNATAPPKGSTQKPSLIDQLGWPLVGTSAGVVLVIIIALIVVLKPKTMPTGQGQWQGTQPPPYMQQPLICPACGSPNAPERRFCSNCGATLLGRGTQQAWRPPPTQQQPIICPVCGFPNNPPDRKFCGNCGTSLITTWQQSPQGPQQPYQGPQQQNYQVYQTFSCPICGAPINKGANPCPNCRNWLDWSVY